MDFLKEFSTAMTFMILSVSSLHAAYQLFKVNSIQCLECSDYKHPVSNSMHVVGLL